MWEDRRPSATFWRRKIIRWVCPQQPKFDRVEVFSSTEEIGKKLLSCIPSVGDLVELKDKGIRSRVVSVEHVFDLDHEIRIELNPDVKWVDYMDYMHLFTYSQSHDIGLGMQCVVGLPSEYEEWAEDARLLESGEAKRSDMRDRRSQLKKREPLGGGV